MTEYKRLEKLAKENNWPLPEPLEKTYTFFKLWKDLERQKQKNERLKNDAN